MFLVSQILKKIVSNLFDSKHKIKDESIEKKIEEIIRVNHAGEYGAVRIYEGQIRGITLRESFQKNYCKKSNNFDKNQNEEIIEIESMRQQEEKHLEFFKNELMNKKILNTIFLPIWDKFGYFGGILSSLLGPNFSMSMTSAVEEVIDMHYLDQIHFLEKLLYCNQKYNELSDIDRKYFSELLEKIKLFRQEEIDHMKYANEYNINSFNSSDFHDDKSQIKNRCKNKINKLANKIFSKFVKIGCKSAIHLSKKI